MTTLSIMIPTGGTIKSNTVVSLFNSFSYLKDIKKHLIMLTSGYSYQNRNIGVKMALDAQSTHIFFLDADMIFQPDYIRKLIDRGLDIVGADYNEKKFPLFSTVKLEDGKGGLVDQKDYPKEPFKVQSVGTGFMLVKMDVFKKLDRPYFQAPCGDTINDFMTEDTYFCNNATKNKVDVWVDPSLKITHLGEYLY